MNVAVEELERDAWFTPGAVAEQGQHGARLIARVQPRQVLDLGAAAGVLGQRAARVFPNARRIGIEIRAAERRYMKRHYHEAIIGDMFDRRRELQRLGVDFVISNPPYTSALEALQLALAVVRWGGWVLFLVRQTFGSSIEAWRFLMDHPPVYEFSIAGRPNMRRGISAAGHVLGGDMVGHTWLLFRRGQSSATPSWQRHLLPPLQPVDLTWRVRPGTERHTPSFSDLYLPMAA